MGNSRHTRMANQANMSAEFLKMGKQLLDYFSDGRTFEATKDWFGASLEFAAVLTAAYLAFVAVGSFIMSRKEEPVAIPMTVGMVYNYLQVALCSYMFIESGLIAYREGYSMVPCNTFNAQKPAADNVVWIFYLSKALDFFDTVQIILGQKWRQLSFLHVYHHSSIFFIYWLNLRLNYDGDIYLTVVLNGAIHSIMYLYYFVSLHTSNIWWKPYVTKLQLVQFFCMLTQATMMLATGCD